MKTFMQQTRTQIAYAQRGPILNQQKLKPCLPAYQFAPPFQSPFSHSPESMPRTKLGIISYS